MSPATGASFERATILARESAENLAMAGRIARDLPAFLRTPITVPLARRLVQQRLDQRSQSFLTLVDGGIYGNRRSPYRKLLANAGCERGDLHRLVADEGIEGALRRLVDAGVYVAFDEFKGRRAAVRGSARFTFTHRDFDNPHARSHHVSYTGGSTGRPVRVGRSFRMMAEAASIFALVLDAHGVRNPTNLLCVTSPFTWLFVSLKLGQPVDGWFPTLERLPLEAILATNYVRVLLRLAGHRMPRPDFYDLLQPEKMVRWLMQHASPTRPAVVYTTTSSAVRVALAATEMGYPLKDVVFHSRSEPLSEPRRRLIERSGARVIQNYASVEMSFVAYSCPRGTAADDLHVSHDRYAIIERERPIFENGPMVDALLLTTLSPNAMKVGLNLELGDSASIVERACGCPLETIGLRTHMSGIRSFEKLSSEGTSFAREDVLRVLEEVLPARFGGTALDYQIVEEEAADGANQLILRIHPEVGHLDEDAVRAGLIEALGSGSLVDEYQAHLIQRAQSIVVRRLVPLATSAGKVLPFHLVRLTQVRR